ncbi:LamG domain-containing protein, partial [candidate division KSB1 bacterium]|nr:LamG domain-containing protein [candidate division KSB1 bacterium]
MDNDKGHQSGSAYLFELFARPGVLSASNGSYADQVILNWKDRSKSEESFYIYRDGEYADYTLQNVTKWVDHFPVPGKVHHYGVSAQNDKWGESDKSCAEGWRQANGKIEGYVRTMMMEGVPGVAVSVFPAAAGFPNILDFNGIGDFVYIPHNDNLNLDQWTVEAWIYPRGNGVIFSRSPGGLPTFEMKYGSADQKASIGFKTAGGASIQIASENLSVPSNQWTHIAGTFNGFTLKIYINGFLNKSIAASAYPNKGEAPVWIGRNAGEFFNGRIDEIRLWSIARDSSDIQADLRRTLQGDEAGLTAYWAFDDSSRALPDIAVDFANNGGHHGVIFGARWQSETPNVMYSDLTDNSGKFSVGKIYYDTEREFVISPSKGSHGFKPASETGVLDLDNSFLTGISFIDTTAITVSGIIRYAGTTCGVEGVKILLDGDSTDVRTLANGSFRIQVDDPGTHTIRPYLGNSKSVHTFNPPQITRNIQDNVSDLEFRDTQKYTLTVTAGGPCGSSFGDATLSVQTLGPNPGCFDTTFTTNGSNPFDIVLPAQKYLMDVVAVNPPNSDITAYFQPDTVDLMWQDTTQMFIYRTKPVIHVSGLLDFGHGDYEGAAIVDQYFTYDLLIEVFDKYGSDSCYVQEGSVTIFDDVSRFSPIQVTLPLENGVARYRLMPGEPDIIDRKDNPYQKLFELAAHVGQAAQNKK